MAKSAILFSLYEFSFILRRWLCQSYLKMGEFLEWLRLWTLDQKSTSSSGDHRWAPFPSLPAVRCGHVTGLWPMECEKWCKHFSAVLWRSKQTPFTPSSLEVDDHSPWKMVGPQDWKSPLDGGEMPTRQECPPRTVKWGRNTPLWCQATEIVGTVGYCSVHSNAASNAANKGENVANRLWKGSKTWDEK